MATKCLYQGGIKTALWPNPQYPFVNFAVSDWRYVPTESGPYLKPEELWAKTIADPKVVWAQVICDPGGTVLHSHGVPTAPAPPQAIPGVSPTPGSGGGGAASGDGQIMIALKRHKGSLVVIAGGIAVLLYLRRGKRKRR